jgi:uncharacterized membrane protein YfcA
MNSWISFKPVSYVGFALAFIGLFGPRLIGDDEALVQWIGIFLFIVGLYLVFKGRKEHGL